MLAAVLCRICPLRSGALTAALSSATATPSADSTVSYLTSTCGLSSTAAARANSARVRLASPRAAAQADAVLALLRRYGFSDADISSAVRQAPILLTADPGKTLQPKLDFLASVGFETPLLQRLVLVSPLILLRSVEGHLKPLFASLREVLGSNARVVAALNTEPFAIRCQPKSAFLTLRMLRDVDGLSATDVSKLLALKASVILLAPDRINQIVELSRKVGVEPGNPMFVRLFCTFSKMKVPKLESKVALYRRLGFHNEAINQIIRRFPPSMNISEKKIAEIIGFLTGKAGLTHEDIVNNPSLVGRSLETLSRRCAVLTVLRRAGKQPQHRLPTLLIWAEKQFLEKYVRSHMEEVPDAHRAMNGEIPFDGFHSLEEKLKLCRRTRR